MNKRPQFLISLLIMLLLLTPTFVTAQGAVAEGTEILWDTWGVPHIFAPDNESLFYAFGWAQMESHGDLILKLYGEARGRAAEYWGVENLDNDIRMHTLDIPAQAELSVTQQSPEFQTYLTAFVAGMNAYAAEHPELIADEREIILPVVPSDIMAHGLRVLRYDFVAGSAFGSANRWEAADSGSNGWAVAPSRSASGNSLLLINPHQPWSDFHLWFEAPFGLS